MLDPQTVSLVVQTIECGKGTIEERMRRAIKEARAHWMVYDRDDPGVLSAAVVKVGLSYGEGSPEYERIRIEMHALNGLGAAMSGGVPVDLGALVDAIPEGFQAIGIHKLWREAVNAGKSPADLPTEQHAEFTLAQARAAHPPEKAHEVELRYALGWRVRVEKYGAGGAGVWFGPNEGDGWYPDPGEIDLGELFKIAAQRDIRASLQQVTTGAHAFAATLVEDGKETIASGPSPLVAMARALTRALGGEASDG